MSHYYEIDYEITHKGTARVEADSQSDAESLVSALDESVTVINTLAPAVAIKRVVTINKG